MMVKRFQNKKNIPNKKLLLEIRGEIRATILFAQTMAESMNMQLSDIRCLDYLIDVESATAGEIAEVTGLTTGAVTAMIDRLEKIKLVKRESNPNDRRHTMIVFTGKNNFFAKNAQKFFTKDIASLLKNYSDKELLIIQNWNKQLTKLFQDKVKKMQK